MIELEHVSFGYAADSTAVDGASLAVRPGERLVVLGRNGSGKSTLGRLMNGSLVPRGGSVSVDGETRDLARLVGYVRQDPRNQIVSSLVSDEVAFGPRNLGLPREEVLARVDEALSTCGIAHLRGRMTGELSGGQQQLLAIAGVVAMRPRYLVLDEVGSQLDEASRRRVSRLVNDLVREGVGVVDVAHSVEALFGADRVAVLSSGHLVWQGRPEDFLLHDDALDLSGLASDSLTRILSRAVAAGYGLPDEPDPKGLAPYVGGLPEARVADAPALGCHELSCASVSLSYDDLRALDGVSLSTRGLTLVLGRSGSGKTTLGSVLAGVLTPDSGRAALDGRSVGAGDVGLAFQRPEDQLFCDTVLDDIAYGPRQRGLGEGAALAAARDAAALLGVGEELLGRSPFELSGGQMRRVALAGVVACGRGALVLDEPTAGLDVESRQELREVVRRLVEGGAAVVVITHDAGEWLEEATSVAFLSEGRLVAVAEPARAAGDPALFEAAGLEAPLSVRLRAALRGSGDA